MTIQGLHFSVCKSRPPGRENCESRKIAMAHLDAKIERARGEGGSAGMLDNGRWELHFPNMSMVLYWVEGPDGDVQRFP